MIGVLFMHNVYSGKASQAYSNKDYTLAYQLWEQAGKKGNVIALYNLGVMELNNKGKSVEFKPSVTYFKKACKKNFALACFELGLMYYKTAAAPHNPKKSIQYIIKAAKQGDPSGQFKLAEHYEKTDIEKAIVWFKKSAKQNFIGSANSLAIIYEKRGDWDKAIYWYKKAVNQDFDALIRARKAPFLKDGKTLNHRRAMGFYVNTSIDEALLGAQFNFGRFYDYVKSKYQDKKLARFWYEKSALQGYNIAQHNLAMLFILGQGGGKDFKKAKYWFEKGAKQNYSLSIFNLGYMHENGLGIPQNSLKAIAFYKKVHGNNRGVADKAIAIIHDNGIGVTKNRLKALPWYIKAGRKNILYAQLRAAEILYSYKRYVRSFHWFNTAAKKVNDPEPHMVAHAQYMVGRMLYSGEGIKQNREQARKWLHKAVKNGSKKAAKMLKQK